METKYVRNCTDCQDEDCAREEHDAGNLPTKCECCPDAPVEFDGDCLGNVHGACASHVQCLHGWVRDFNRECQADSIASARYESWAYGD